MPAAVDKRHRGCVPDAPALISSVSRTPAAYRSRRLRNGSYTFLLPSECRCQGSRMALREIALRRRNFVRWSSICISIGAAEAPPVCLLSHASAAMTSTPTATSSATRGWIAKRSRSIRPQHRVSARAEHHGPIWHARHRRAGWFASCGGRRRAQRTPALVKQRHHGCQHNHYPVAVNGRRAAAAVKGARRVMIGAGQAAPRAAGGLPGDCDPCRDCRSIRWFRPIIPIRCRAIVTYIIIKAIHIYRHIT